MINVVLIRKAYRCRVYPSPGQEALLVAWESALRWLWNLANEQRKMGRARPRDERRFPTAFDQINELTVLREHSIVCEVEMVDPAPRTAPIVAIDHRGITNLIADSDGRIVPNPKHLEQTLRQLAHAQRVISRRKKGSKNREKAKLRVARLHRKVCRQRDHVLYCLRAAYAKSHGTVVVEKLNVQGMVKNRNLARHIAGASWGRFAEMLRCKLAWNGGQLIEVPAAYSSQSCSACGVVDAESRRREHFCCTRCGYVAHADLNAAKVLKSRANCSDLPVEASGKLPSRRNRKLRTGLRVPRRSPSESSVL